MVEDSNFIEPVCSDAYNKFLDVADIFLRLVVETCQAPVIDCKDIWDKAEKINAFMISKMPK